MTDILDKVADLAIAPLTNTPLTSTDTVFEINDLAGDISRFPDPGTIGYYAWVWAREPSFGNVGDADRAGQAERVRVTGRDVGNAELTVTRGASPIDLNAAGVTYWIVASMNAQIIEDIDDRIFDLVAGDLVTDKKVDAPSAEFDAIDLIAATPGVGSLDFFEDTANGTSKVTLQAPSALAGDVALTLLDALPGATEFLTVTSGGVIGTSPATTSISLDDAYDNGGSGLGRIITADSGPVEIADADGLQITHSAPQMLWETTGANYNWRFVASAVDTMLFQRGDADSDVSDDTFVNTLILAGSTRRVGVNVGTPQDTLHVLDTDALSRLRLQTTNDGDSSILLQNVGSPTWEFGYDTSEAAFIVGRQSFSNKAISVIDGTARIGLGDVAPTARVHVKTTGDEVALIVDGSSTVTHRGIDIVRSLASIYDYGDIRFPVHPNRPINTDEGDFWYQDGTASGRFEGYNGEGVDCIMGPNPTFGIRAQRQIAAGVVSTLNGRGFLEVQAQTGTADDLDTINAGGFRNGDCLLITPFPGDTITVKHGTGNIDLDGSADKVLVNNNILIVSYNLNDSTWRQVTPMMVLP